VSYIRNSLDCWRSQNHCKRPVTKSSSQKWD